MSEAVFETKLEALGWIHEGHEGDTLIAAPGEPVINITAMTARRRVSGYVGSNISYLMGGDEPALMFSKGCLVWRVPVVLTSPRRGKIGVVGVMDVDARTGQLLIPMLPQANEKLRKQIEARAQALVASETPSPTV
jgi:hypothetical protein